MQAGCSSMCHGCLWRGEYDKERQLSTHDDEVDSYFFAWDSWIAISFVCNQGRYSFTQFTIPQSNSYVHLSGDFARRIKMALTILVMHFKSLDVVELYVKNCRKVIMRNSHHPSVSTNLTAWTSPHLRKVKIRIHSGFSIDKPRLQISDRSIGIWTRRVDHRCNSVK